MKIFITGEPRVGKTTLIKEIVEILIKNGFTISGFITEEIKIKGERVGFKICDLATKEELIFASKEKKSDYVFGKYYLNIDNLETIFRISLKRDFDILIIDEIGKMEFFSEFFKQKIFELMNSNINIIGVLHRSFVDKFNRYGKIFVLNFNNRHSIKNSVLNLILREVKIERKK